MFAPVCTKVTNVRLFIVTLFRDNWFAAYAPSGGQMQDFFSVFSVYFPAGIGILAGANVSGDLKVRLISCAFCFVINYNMVKLVVLSES